MGAGQSVEASPVFQSFISSLVGKKLPLSVEELWSAQMPKFVSEVDFFNVAVLFTLDQDGDGKFSLADLTAFGEMVCLEALNFSENQIGERINGLCLLRFLEVSPEPLRVARWMLKMCSNDSVATVQVSRDTLAVLHKLMSRGAGRSDVSFYEFYSIVEQCDRNDRRKDWVDSAVVEAFLVAHIGHFSSLLRKALK